MLEQLSLAIIADHFPTCHSTPRSLDDALQLALPITIISNFPHTYDHLAVTIHQDIIRNKGLLGSFYTALFTSPRRHVLVLTPDMPLPETELLFELSDHAQRYDGAAAPLNGLQPFGFGAVYSKVCLGTLWEQIQRDHLALEDFYQRAQIARLQRDQTCSMQP